MSCHRRNQCLKIQVEPSLFLARRVARVCDEKWPNVWLSVFVFEHFVLVSCWSGYFVTFPGVCILFCSLSRSSSDEPSIVAPSHHDSPYNWPVCWYIEISVGLTSGSSIYCHREQTLLLLRRSWVWFVRGGWSSIHWSCHSGPSMQVPSSLLDLARLSWPMKCSCASDLTLCSCYLSCLHSDYC